MDSISSDPSSPSSHSPSQRPLPLHVELNSTSLQSTSLDPIPNSSSMPAMDSPSLSPSDMSPTTEISGSGVPENGSHSTIAQGRDPVITCMPSTNDQSNHGDDDIAQDKDMTLHDNNRSSEVLPGPGPSTLQILPPQQEQFNQEKEQQQQQQQQQQTPPISPVSSQQHLHTDDSTSQLPSPQTVSNPSSEPRIGAADLPLSTSSSFAPAPLNHPSRAPLPPQLTLNSIPIFTSADEPPPYSPTHTILPHYFSLVPIPIRSYIIKDSASIPFLYDFWLCTTPQRASPGLLFQERGLSQTQNELKYCIIRPQHTDKTALSGPSAQNAYFIPALALVAANHPSRWIWWGTEALQMVVFGRQAKNIIMEWKWKHGRLRIGGPVVHLLIGCSFQITSDRKYCWKQGSGRKRPATARQNRANQQRDGNGARRDDHSASTSPSSPSELTNRIAGGSWVGSFFSRSTPNQNATNISSVLTSDIPMNHVQIAIPSTPSPETSNSVDSSVPPTRDDNVPLSEQEAVADQDDDEDEEVGCYHCREENSVGTTGRIVAVYRPGRPANRSRDRPASSPKLEIYTELGERCETAMMLMCIRLDDLFMSIPDEKKGPFVSDTGQGNGGANTQQSIDAVRTNVATTDAEAENGSTMTGDNRSELSMLKRLLRRHTHWRVWLKWIVAAILIAVVVILVFKSKLQNKN
ncbi:hypothetical protein BGZ79_006819 [Entomortierella chlamydospora]|nr:hypothetical protein BGZ79_006819 [Entomortierella chlamydospora]